MTRKIKILIVDDDPQIGELVQAYLSQYDYQVIIAHDGHTMKRKMRDNHIDLVILDVMLPGEDGLSLCRKLREESDVSIIMLSAVSEEADRIIGLEVGADDYLCKPFSSRELLARIKSLLRRSTGQLGVQRNRSHIGHMPNLRFLNWELDLKKHQLISPEKITIPLSNGEYELLLAFVENAGRVMTRDQLMDLTTGREAGPFDRSVDVQVARLRKKLENDPKKPQIILTIRGGGYQFKPEVEKVES